MRPLLFGGMYNHLTPLVTRQLASLAPAGGLSLLAVTQQLYGTANSVLDKSLVIPASPTLAVQARNGQWRNFRSLYRRRLALLLLLAGAGFVCVLAFGRPALALLVGRGGVTAENVDSLWWMLSALGVAFMSNVAGQPVFAAFCAKGDTRTPVRLAFIINTVNIPLRALAFWTYGLTGMALMMSAAAAVGLLVNLYVLEKSIPAADRPEPARGGGPGLEGGDETLLAARVAADAT